MLFKPTLHRELILKLLDVDTRVLLDENILILLVELSITIEVFDDCAYNLMSPDKAPMNKFDLVLMFIVLDETTLILFEA
jgi:hypothetical protein